ncbi:MAG: hypothetical protein LBR28_00940 [Bacteroidales bacterium]|jgi:hypothetical protein|nr:hypothetical protein [Bacteroidales bacterium]
MKRVIFLSLACSVLSFASFSQKKHFDTIKTNFTFSTGIAAGTTFLNDNFTSSYLSFGVSHQINKDLRLRANVATSSFNTSFCGNYESKIPYRNPYNKKSAQVGVDYKLSERMSLSVTAYYDQVNLGSMQNNFHTNRLTTAAFNANFTYKLRNDSYFNLNVTFLETNNPYTIFNTYYNNFSPCLGTFAPNYVAGEEFNFLFH